MLTNSCPEPADSPKPPCVEIFLGHEVVHIYITVTERCRYRGPSHGEGYRYGTENPEWCLHPRVAVGEGGAGDASGLFGNRFDGARVQAYGGPPLNERRAGPQRVRHTRRIRQRLQHGRPFESDRDTVGDALSKPEVVTSDVSDGRYPGEPTFRRLRGLFRDFSFLGPC